MATIEGADRLRKQMKAFPAAAREEISKAMEVGAAEMVEFARRLVPVDSGDLRDSIGWSWGEAPKGSMALTTIGGSRNLKITIYAGNDRAFYARFQEFGTRDRRAQPYFFPAYRALRKRMRSRVSRAINKAAKRAIAL